jgi:DNA-binding response OmpR family regulator
LSSREFCARVNATANAPPIVVVSSADEAFEPNEHVACALRKPVNVAELRQAVSAQVTDDRRRRR